MVDVTPLHVVARHVVAQAIAMVWPPTCVLCGGRGEKPTRDLCSACAADLPANDAACSVCAEPLAAQGVDLLCGSCLKRAPRFDVACCAFRYAYPVDYLIRRLKYQGAIAQSRVLGELLAFHLRKARSEPLPELLIPVPLAQKRFQARGYNQAVELGRHLERRLCIPMRSDLVERTRETAEQAGLGQKERRRNIRGAFALTAPLRAKHVAIVDDVITTGSTANELARVLKRAGARRIEVWAVARAGR